LSLRQQLLLVSLLLLALPWAGCQFVQETENTLQHGQEQALLATSQAVAAVLSGQAGLLYPQPARLDDGDDTRSIYAPSAGAPPIVDGYADGWPVNGERRFGPVGVRARTFGNRLFLLLRVEDPEVVYHDPTRRGPGNGDRLVLRDGKGRNYVIATAAPGAVQARYRSADGRTRWEVRVRGFWQDTVEGYNVELEMPLALLHGRLGFHVIDDSTSAGTSAESWHGNSGPNDREASPWLIYPPAALQAKLSPFAGEDLQLRVIDRSNWIIAQAGEIDGAVADAAVREDATHWLIRAIYRASLSGQPLENTPMMKTVGRFVGRESASALAGVAATEWYRPANQQQKQLRAATPVTAGNAVIGAVVAEQANERYLSLTDAAFSRLLAVSMATIGLATLGMLGYASWLSWRIRGLAAASRDIFGEDGRIRDDFPISRSGDELGDLSRQYAALLNQLREYTDYLRSLSRKLAHELRTPIAVIQSSLDNLQASDADRVYLQRAGDGLERLKRILTAMSEATRLEESIDSNSLESFDLVALCADLFDAYAALYVDRKLTFSCNVDRWPTRGSPELIAQMLDKLMDNARDFSPDGGSIRLAVHGEQELVKILVDNEGPLLPDTMQGQLFDPMVSVREGSDGVHLGLGLHVASLIARFHGGVVSAVNRSDGSGVVFTVSLPRQAIRA
jgi:dedicated sortase system histidine kinase